MAMTGAAPDLRPGRSRAVSLLHPAAGVLALLLAASALVPLPDGEEIKDCCQPPPQLEEALEDVETGEAEKEAKEIAAQDGLVAAGTPCFMRHKRMALGVNRDFRHRFAAATLATDPAQKEAILAGLATAASPGLPAWRVALARAELALRDGRSEDAFTHLRTAASEEVPLSCRSDELFLQAAVTPDAGASAELMDRAVAADPGFWAAQERLALLAAGGTGRDATTCGLDAARAIRAAIQLGALASTDTQFERLERGLLGLDPNGRTQLLRGMILRQTGRAGEARALWSTALTALGASACDATLRIALERMIENTPEAQP